MSQITSQMVKELRDQTGAGMMDCKNALTESNGNVQDAIDILRKKGLKSIDKRAGRDAKEGLIYSYLHPNNRVGVMLELNCETDFVARNDDFREAAKSISMHVAWANPRYLTREEVPEDVIAREREVARSQLTPQQEKMADKIIDGRLEKFYQGVCLLDQVDLRDESNGKTIGDLITDLSAKVGEKVVLRRFSRFELGENISA